ncbi:MAG: ParA family protein [Minisyncoccia bacterium]
MARVISIMNAKGGTGKTTTAMNLGAYLAIFGKKTLLIDFDSQFNATVGLGIKHNIDETIYHILFANKQPEQVIKKTALTNFECIPASADLAGALVELVNVPQREYFLKKFIDEIKNNYDFILIDLGPSLNLLTINGLIASDEVLIPVQCEYYSLEGLSQLLEIIDLIRNNLGHNLKVSGALLTMYDKRERLSREVAKEVRRRFPYNVFDIEIPKSIALAEAPSFQKPVVLYAPQSIGALAYEKLAQEIINQNEILIESNHIDSSQSNIINDTINDNINDDWNNQGQYLNN